MTQDKKDNITLDPIKKILSENEFNISSLEKLIKSAAGDAVGDIFSHLITEDEKKNQKSISKEIEDLNLRAETDKEVVQDEQESDPPEEKKVTDTSSPKVKAQKLPSGMEPDDVAEMINIIRAGKSLKDGEVRERFDIWWDLLSPPEKIALKAFLDGIAQITTTDVTAEDASKPSASPYNVEMNSSSRQSPRKASLDPGEKNSKETTFDDEDSPIIVGEVSNISEIKKRMIK
tara:strand:- start:2059 stop:2754 length:696 start_codon:yes stop_codon:yes gene_type:complete